MAEKFRPQPDQSQPRRDAGEGSRGLPDQPKPQKEGVVDELTRLLGKRGNNLIFDAHVREAGRQLREQMYKELPSREEEARLREEERKYEESLPPEEQHQYQILKCCSNGARESL